MSLDRACHLAIGIHPTCGTNNFGPNAHFRNRHNRFNKAVYTAALVADGWEGAENLEKQLCDGRTDRLTDGWTDGPKSG